MTRIAEGLLALARLSLALGRTERITRHEDGARPESVAEHTVMLAWCAMSIADAWFPGLDQGEIARFALCHDAPEAICGDTPTLRISEAERAEKAEREELAIAEIESGTEPLPWLARSIRNYESAKGGGSREAAFVHAVDKLMPKLTHILNGGVTLRDSGISRVELDALLRRQRSAILESLPVEVGSRLAELQEELSRVVLAVPLAAAESLG